MTLRYQDFAGELISPDRANEILLVQHAKERPFLAALAALGEEEALQPVFEWGVDAHPDRRNQINNGGVAYTSGTTTLVVDSSAPFYPGCLILAEATGEVMYCSSITDGTTIVVIRGVGNVVAAHANSVANDAWLRNIGPARGEGAETPADRTTGPTVVGNQCQIFREAISITGTMQATKTLTPDERARQRAKKFEELMTSKEHAYLFGARNTVEIIGADGKVVRTTKGLIQAITTNVWNAGGTITEATLINNFLAPLFHYGSGEKYILCGATLLNAINAIYKGSITYKPGANAVGMYVGEVMTSYGVLKPIHAPILTGAYAGWGVAFDPAHIKDKVLRRLEMKADRQGNGTDGIVDEWLGEMGLKWGAENAHGVIKGVTGVGS